uniref:Uncharacterized protein n=1 Tax=Lepeophtheirus salmonis TaxID=72036 RepID=A0A0K2TQU7_LEPSM
MRLRSKNWTGHPMTLICFFIFSHYFVSMVISFVLWPCSKIHFQFPDYLYMTMSMNVVLYNF